jgi:hypothetical protein
VAPLIGGGLLYAEGTSEGSWLLISVGLILLVAGIVAGVIAVRRFMARRP